MNAETAINSQNKSQTKSTSAFVNSRKGLTNSTVSVEHFVNCLWATTKNYFHWNLELWRDSQRIPSFFFVATENLELCNNEQRHSFYFESSASVLFSASGLDKGLEETSFWYTGLTIIILNVKKPWDFVQLFHSGVHSNFSISTFNLPEILLQNSNTCTSPNSHSNNKQFRLSIGAAPRQTNLQ